MKTNKLESINTRFNVAIPDNDNGIYYITGQRVNTRALAARVVPFYYVNTPTGKMYVGYIVYKTNILDKTNRYTMLSNDVVCTKNVHVLLGLNDATDIIHIINGIKHYLGHIIHTNDLNIDII